MEPSLRQAVERVNAWHQARWRAHIEPPEPTMPPPPTPTPEVLPPVTDPVPPGKTPPVRDPQPTPRMANA